MKKINRGIVFSEDIKRILDGVNAFDYDYEVTPDESIVKEVRENFKKETNKIFGNVSIISEEEMLQVNNFIRGEYPHCNT